MSRRASPHDGFLFHAVTLTILWNRPCARAFRSRCCNVGRRNSGEAKWLPEDRVRSDGKLLPPLPSSR